MSSRQRKIVFAAIIFVLALWIISSLVFTSRGQALPISRAPLSFDASAAYLLTQNFVVQFPRRVLGSLESRQSTGYIHDNLEKLGYAISYSHFDARIARRKQVGRNVLAYKQGESSEILTIVAHLDTAKTTEQGAMKNGSGVGVLLELARVFSATPTRRSMLFVFSDGGEWGSVGAKDLAVSFPDRNRIAAVLSLDHVSIGDLGSLCLEERGQLKGFSPAWLRQLAREAAESTGVPVQSASGISEYMDRALLISWADQGPFLSEGIPAINLGSKSIDVDRAREVYHSQLDTIEKLTPASIGRYGLAAERIVRSLDELPSIPKGAPDSFRFRDAHYLSSGMMLTIQIMSFLPLALVLFFHLKNHGRQMTLVRIGREFLAYLGTVLPFFAIYFLIALSRALRLLPVYTLYPATTKDPVLTSPPWGVLAGIFGIALLVAAVCCVIAMFSSRSLPKPDFFVSKTVLLTILLVAIALSLSYNAYWASLFLVLPAWIWSLTGYSRNPGTRMLNLLLILAAGIAYYVVLWVYAHNLGMSWSFVWYQVLALSNGLFSKTAYFLAAGIIAVGIRFLAIQYHKSDSIP